LGNADTTFSMHQSGNPVGSEYRRTLSLLSAKRVPHTHKSEPLHHKFATERQEVHAVAAFEQAAMI